jgi:hypothetical protein
MKLIDYIDDVCRRMPYWNKSQRALAAVKVAALYKQVPALVRKDGRTDITLAAARKLDVSVGLVSCAREVLGSGDPELILKVVRREMSVTKASQLAKKQSTPTLRKLLSAWQCCTKADRERFFGWLAVQ